MTNNQTAMQVVMNIKTAMEKGEKFTEQTQWIEGNTSINGTCVAVLVGKIEQANLYSDLQVIADMLAVEIK